MARGFGIENRPARAQLRRLPAESRAEPLPAPYRPGSVAPATLGITDPGAQLSFFTLGDVGGVKTPAAQNAVSVAMQQAQTEAAFALVLGDVVYYNGQEAGDVDGQQTGYKDQFYEPYAKLLKPIIAFPGNHDGDPQPGDTSLSGFMANFCAARPGPPPVDPELEFGRDTQTLPYCEWTLELEAVTIVAVYTNVPEGGQLQPEQTRRLARVLTGANPDKPLIVGLHHPPYSIDTYHGSSPRMQAALDEAFSASGRVPDMVLSGHVHDYQRYTRTVDGKQVAYLVVGTGGYHNLHRLATDVSPGDQLGDGLTYEFGDASHYGYLKLTVSGGRISGEFVGVRPGTMPDGSDAQITPSLDTF